MVVETNRAYPAQYETEVLLRDGSRILLRPVKVEDSERWLAFSSRLSRHSKYLRYHHVPRELKLEEAIRACTVDYKNSFAFVAEVLREKRKDIIAVGNYYRLPNKHTAEVAFTIEDAYQGKGIGTKLMEWLVNVARDNGISTFVANVLTENKQMLAVLREYGFHITSEREEDEYVISFPLSRTRRVERRETERERSSTLASLRSILYPRSVAVIGASRDPSGIGQAIFQAIIRSGFTGGVYPVNPNAKVVSSIKAYPSVSDIPDDIDLAVIAVPAYLVAEVADSCGHKGVHTAIVVSDGFRERGPEGTQLENELREVTLGHGMRLLGPNCMGVINTDPTIRLNATPSQSCLPRGNVACLSEGGALGLAILDYATSLNMGISSFISVGNRADISSNDLLQYWEQNPSTRVIILYLESFGNPRKFARIARRVSTTKPIIVVKSGSTPAGSRAALSHTGALVASEVASDALFRQAGIIRVNTLEGLFDVAMLLSSQPVPRGKRVAIVTNGGGPGTLAADACEHHGLELPEFSTKTGEALKSVIEQDIIINNPLNVTARAEAKEFESVLRILADDPGIDAVIAIFMPPIMMDTHNVENAVRRAAPLFQQRRKPLVTCFMGERGFWRGGLKSRGKSIPCCPFPEDAVSALAKAVEYGQWLDKPKGSIPKINGIKRSKAKKTVERAMTQSAKRPLWLSVEEIAILLNCYDIRFAETVPASTPADAISAASRIGFPVAVKLVAPTIIHKTDVGGVILNLNTADAVEQAFYDIGNRLAKLNRQDEMEGVVVQRMVDSQTDVIIGVTQDPSFGPLIMFGLGGIYFELLQEMKYRLHPLTNMDARELVNSVKTVKLLEDARGAPLGDMASLEGLLLRLSAMVEDLPQIAELDLYPVKVMSQGEGYCVVDARIMLR